MYYSPGILIERTFSSKESTDKGVGPRSLDNRCNVTKAEDSLPLTPADCATLLLLLTHSSMNQLGNNKWWTVHGYVWTKTCETPKPKFSEEKNNVLHKWISVLGLVALTCHLIILYLYSLLTEDSFFPRKHINIITFDSC